MRKHEMRKHEMMEANNEYNEYTTCIRTFIIRINRQFESTEKYHSYYQNVAQGQQQRCTYFPQGELYGLSNSTQR